MLLAPEYAITQDDIRQDRIKRARRAREKALEEVEEKRGTQTAAGREEEEKQWILANRNRNTARTYESGWKQFESWVNTFENPIRTPADYIRPTNPSNSDVAAYIRYIVEVKEGTMGSVAVALAAISDKLRYSITSTYDPCNSIIVQQTKAVLAPRARKPVQKMELTWQRLERVLEATAVQTSRSNRRDALMFLLAYCSLLRISEIARMDRKDIFESTEELEGKPTQVLHIRVNPLAKNDKERKGHERLVAEKPARVTFCLVRMMREYTARDWRTGQDGALFQTEEGARLNIDTPRGRLHHWLHAARISDPSQYGFHSLRAGGATDAAQAGVSARDIQMHGDWKSLAVLLYIRPQLSNRLAVGMAVGEDEEEEEDEPIARAAARRRPTTVTLLD